MNIDTSCIPACRILRRWSLVRYLYFSRSGMARSVYWGASPISCLFKNIIVICFRFVHFHIPYLLISHKVMFRIWYYINMNMTTILWCAYYSTRRVKFHYKIKTLLKEILVPRLLERLRDKPCPSANNILNYPPNPSCIETPTTDSVYTILY